MIGKLKKGFTLIELLIVIAIIGILTVAFLPTLRGGQASARDAARKAAVGSIATIMASLVNGNATGVTGVMSVPASDGACMNFTAPAISVNGIKDSSGVAIATLELAIRTALSRNPDVPTSTPICDAGYYYRAYGTNFVLAAGLEQEANGNFYSSTTVDAITNLSNALGATWSDVLTNVSKKESPTEKQQKVYVMTQ